MAERHRSNDGKKETEALDLPEGKVSQQGSSDGNLARKVGSRDEEKRSVVKPAGATRVEGSDKRHEGLDENKTEGGV